jgi:hypothetical protein
MVLLEKPPKPNPARKDQRLRYGAALACVFLGVVCQTAAGTAAGLGEEGPSYTKSGEPYYPHNEWIETAPDGTLLRNIRWAIGARDHVELLKVPQSYIEFSGGCFAFDHVDSNCKQPYSSIVLLRAMLPDFRPLPGRPISREEDNDVVHLNLQSNLIGPRTDLDTRRPVGFAKQALSGRVPGFSPKGPVLVEKEPRFGLRRIGLPDDVIERVVSTPDTGILDEYYIPQNGSGEFADSQTCEPIVALPDDTYRPVAKACIAWLSSDLFITCMAEALPYSGEPTHAHYVPSCQAAFTQHSLSAFVVARFDRRHLPEWRRIVSHSKVLLENFLK